MSGYFTDLWGGAVSLLEGMWVTLKEFPKRPVTVGYPHEHLKMYRRFRGHIELIAGKTAPQLRRLFHVRTGLPV
jgi:hypothetical protein